MLHETYIIIIIPRLSGIYCEILIFSWAVPLSERAISQFSLSQKMHFQLKNLIEVTNEVFSALVLFTSRAFKIVRGIERKENLFFRGV